MYKFLFFAFPKFVNSEPNTKKKSPKTSYLKVSNLPRFNAYVTIFLCSFALPVPTPNFPLPPTIPSPP